jgi:preprotein translocase subunit SecA
MASLLARWGRHDGNASRAASRILDQVQAEWDASRAAWNARWVVYDEVLASQRHVVYAERQAVLPGTDVHDRVARLIDETVRAEVAAAGRLTADELIQQLRDLYPVSVTPEELAGQPVSGKPGLPAGSLADHLAADAGRVYQRREAELGSELLSEVERRIILSATDRAWREHLWAIDDLLDSIGRRYPHDDSMLAGYRREAADLFAAMRAAARKDIVSALFYWEVEIAE